MTSGPGRVHRALGGQEGGPRERCRHAGRGQATLGAILSVMVAVGCGGGPSEIQVLVDDVDSPVALVALPGGGLRYAERLTGQVREVDGRGRLRSEPVARVEVSSERQRGLLGLAVDARDRTFAAWTDPQEVILVGQVAPGTARVLWQGPASARVGNGGHLEFSPDGRLLVGVGDLARGDHSGRLLALDPDGPPSQHPEVLSSGWNNPFAFGFAPSGQLWVADNAPGTEPERITRLLPGGEATFTKELTGPHIVPSALVALSDTEVVLCAYLARQLILYDARLDQRRTLAEGCRTGVVRLHGGDLAYATADEIRVLKRDS